MCIWFTAIILIFLNSSTLAITQTRIVKASYDTPPDYGSIIKDADNETTIGAIRINFFNRTSSFLVKKLEQCKLTVDNFFSDSLQ